MAIQICVNDTKNTADLEIYFNDGNYRSNAIANGRIIKKFFKRLSENIFKNSVRHSLQYKKYTGENVIPLLYSERNLYSLFASSINQITPIHLSEWSFNKTQKLSKNRRVDYWCMYKEQRLSKPVNFFIEVKNGWYCLNEKSHININKVVIEAINNLTNQLRELRCLQPNFNSKDHVYLGIFVVYGFYQEGNEHYCSEDLHDEFYKVIDKRTIKHHLISTWKLPDNIPVQWKRDNCRFVSIIGMPINQ